MAGLLSTVGVLLRFASNVSEEGIAKGTLTTLEDKKVQLASADGSMLKLVGNYIVEPVAVVSDDLRDVEELDSILGLHMDLFTGYYMQVFDILRDSYGLSINTIIDTLATDSGGLNKIITKGISKGIVLGTENDDLYDYLGDLVRNVNYAVAEDGSLFKVSHEAETVEEVNGARETDAYYAARGQSAGTQSSRYEKGSRQIQHRLDKDSARAKKIGELEIDKATIDDREILETRISRSRQRGKNIADAENAAALREGLKTVDPSERQYLLNRDTERVASTLSEAAKDLLIPNAIQRTIQLTVENVFAEPGTDGQFHTKTVIIPITIKLSVIFTSKDNIINAIESNNDMFSFSDRLDDYRSGAISLTDFVFASDLVNKYKKHKRKDTDALLSLIKSRELSANSKMITNGFAGFEKYYNMYLVSPEVKVAIEKSIRSKLSSPKGKDKYLEQANGLSVTIVDPDYERIQMLVKDIRGRTDLSFRNAVKKDKNGSDYSEIIKALMANKPPAF